MVFADQEDDQEIINVLIVTENHLLGDAVEAILTRKGRLRVCRTMQHLNLVQRIDQQRPQVVVIEQSLLTGAVLKNMAERLQGYGRLRIIIINPNNNYIHICNNLGTSLLQATDFVNLMKNPSA